MSTKPTNPKDAIGIMKADMGLVPDTAVLALSEAFLEGALKYGCYNWRVAGVRASVYHAALRRHVAKWWNGQERDPKTHIPHLHSALACIAILIDARTYDKLNDDRPPAPDPDATARAIDALEDSVKRLKMEFETYAPHQYTIADTPPLIVGGGPAAPTEEEMLCDPVTVWTRTDVPSISGSKDEGGPGDLAKVPSPCKCGMCFHVDETFGWFNYVRDQEWMLHTLERCDTPAWKTRAYGWVRLK